MAGRPNLDLCWAGDRNQWQASDGSDTNPAYTGLIFVLVPEYGSEILHSPDFFYRVPEGEGLFIWSIVSASEFVKKKSWALAAVIQSLE